MRKNRALLFCLYVCLFVFSSCAPQEPMNYDSKQYVELGDYSSIEIENEYTIISKDDVEAIVEMELSVNQVYVEIFDRENIQPEDIIYISIDTVSEYYYIGSESYTAEFDDEIIKMKKGATKKLKTAEGIYSNVTIEGIYRLADFDDTEFVLNYYGFSSLDELTEFIKKRAADEIVFNHIFDKLYEESVFLGFPVELEEAIESDLKEFEKETLKKYATVEEYLQINDLSDDDLLEIFRSRYYEIMLYKAVLDEENISITSKDIERFAQENTIENYNVYDIYEELANEIVREILTSKAMIIK